MRRLTLALALVAVGHAVGDEASQKELKQMQGKWVATALHEGGAKVPKEALDKGEVWLSVDGSRFVFTTPKQTYKGTMTLDPSAKPKTLDLTMPAKDGKKKVIHCIYERDGKQLRIAGDQEKRPKDFTSKLGGAIVVTLKRGKD